MSVSAQFVPQTDRDVAHTQNVDDSNKERKSIHLRYSKTPMESLGSCGQPAQLYSGLNKLSLSITSKRFQSIWTKFKETVHFCIKPAALVDCDLHSETSKSFVALGHIMTQLSKTHKNTAVFEPFNKQLRKREFINKVNGTLMKSRLLGYS